MYFDEFKHQLPDDRSGRDRRVARLVRPAGRAGGREPGSVPRLQAAEARPPAARRLPPLTQTRYINTISPEQEPFFPGDESIELRIRRIIRWNAVAMVLRANSQFSGIGGHLATYASAASLYEVGSTTSSRARTTASRATRSSTSAAPGIYGRAFLEGRLSEDQLDHFRRESNPGEGLPSYPHPRLMPDFWEFPTVSMGWGRSRPSTRPASTATSRTAASSTRQGPGLGVRRRRRDRRARDARRAPCRLPRGLDNLTFVVNCNLQRLDGPVR